MSRPDWLDYEPGPELVRVLRRHLRVPGDLVWAGDRDGVGSLSDSGRLTQEGVFCPDVQNETHNISDAERLGQKDVDSGTKNDADLGGNQEIIVGYGQPVHQGEGSESTGLFSPVSIIPPYDFTHSFRVKPNDSGQSLLNLLQNRFPYRDESAWRERILSGLVLLNGSLVRLEVIVKANDSISHRNTGVVEPSVPFDIRILHRNEHVVWIDKPAPMPVHPGGRYNRNTVISLLEPELGPLHVVHRLDSVTAGIMVFARNKETASIVQQWFARGMAEKIYECIVSGVPSEEDIVVDKGISRDLGIRFRCDAAGSRAQTRFRVLERGEGWARVECRPVTGRTHQIRLHLREWGYPIWDDPLYGPAAEDLGDGRALQRRAISLVSMCLRFGV